MAKVIRVKYENGVLKPLEKLDVSEGEVLLVKVLRTELAEKGLGFHSGSWWLVSPLAFIPPVFSPRRLRELISPWGRGGLPWVASSPSHCSSSSQYHPPI